MFPTASSALRLTALCLLVMSGTAGRPARAQQATVPPPLTGYSGATDNSAAVAEPETTWLPLTLRDVVESALAESQVIRVLNGGVRISSITPLDVEAARARWQQECGRFQPRLSANFDATQIDEPPNAFFGPGIAANTKRHETSAGLSVTQPLKSGGSVRIGLEPPLAYLYFPNGVNPGEFNPIYTTDYVVRITQPVLQGAGRDVVTSPIRIAAIEARQSQHELQESLNSQMRSLVEAYWKLYAACLRLQAINAILPIADESVRIEQLRVSAERSIPADVARARFQRDGFLQEAALQQGEVRRRSLQLRQLMGGPSMLEPLLLPSDQPQEAPPHDDPALLIPMAIESRPYLQQLRDGLARQRIVLDVAHNRVLPSLDLRGEYRMNGITERIDDSFDQAASSDYTDWTLGFGVNVPLGNQTALARRREAELQLLRDQVLLAAAEDSVSFEVTELVSDLQAQWESLVLTRRQAQETQEWLRISRIRYAQPPASGIGEDSLLLALTDLQSAMRSWVSAVGNVSEALADYNILHARLSEAQGLSMVQWVNEQNRASSPQLSAGHSGFANQSYRANPELVLERIQLPPADAQTDAASANESPSPVIQAGHSFLNRTAN